jgi:integrase
MSQPDAWPMIRRRAAAAGIAAPIGCHTFRATGITAYLSNGGALEHAQEMAAHESPRTTKLYDRTKERLTRTDQVGNSRIIVKHGARSPAHPGGHAMVFFAFPERKVAWQRG